MNQATTTYLNKATPTSLCAHVEDDEPVMIWMCGGGGVNKKKAETTLVEGGV